MPSNKSVSDAPIRQFINCRLTDCRGGLTREDLWVRDGRILDPQSLFFDEQGYADERIDCHDSIISPCFIDTQINGGYNVDFSQVSPDVGAGVSKVAKMLLQHGVTSFCPTLVTSPPQVYHQVLPQVKVCNGGAHGAGVLGLHLEGPFINKDMRGAHPEDHIRSLGPGAAQQLLEVYGGLDGVRIVTLAPELPGGMEAVEELRRRSIVVSVGHSKANLAQAEEAVQHGATFITHLYNAMDPFHHRDPGILGLLTSERLPQRRPVFYGLIADGIHTAPTALRIAHRAHPHGLVLVTDAVAAMGLPAGRHRLGQEEIEIKGSRACVAGTETLAGSVATMDMCVRHMKDATGCSATDALNSASLHPAQLLGITDKKGTLEYGTEADFVLLDDDLHVRATYIAGEKVWSRE